MSSKVIEWNEINFEREVSSATQPVMKRKNGFWQVAVGLEPDAHDCRFMAGGRWPDDPEFAVGAANPFGVEDADWKPA